jgi:terminase small subunit / prophage DNA-packing protein
MNDRAATGSTRLRDATKRDVAEFFGVSLPSVEGWIRRGCPVIHRPEPGTGGAYKFDLLAVAEWRFLGARKETDIDPETLPPGERKAWYEGEQKRLSILETQRDLIPRADVERSIAVAFAAIAQGIRAIPDNLERRYGVSPVVAEQVEEMLFLELDALAARMGELAPVEAPEAVPA